MRENKFRGRIRDRFVDRGKFWYWSLPDTFDNDYVDFLDWETVGQYTELKDKNGREIFEGDILKRGDTTDEVIFKEGAFCIKFYSKNYKSHYIKTMQEALSYGINRWEIIGNVYENPELLLNKK